MDLASCKEVVLLRLPITEPPSDGGCAQVWEGSVGGAGLVWFKEVALLRLPVAEPSSGGGCAQVWEGGVGGVGLVWFKEVVLLRLQIALLLLMAGSPLHRLPALPT